MSILDNRPALKAEIDKIARGARLIWEKGWAEKNCGNFAVNITEFTDAEMKALPAIAGPFEIGMKLPYLSGCWFFTKGTGKRMRDLADDPMANGCILRILPGGEQYEIVADAPIQPTLELHLYLTVHNHLIAKGSPYKVALHVHPIELVALTHSTKWLKKDVASLMLWSMLPETKASCPKGLGMVPYLRPSSTELSLATINTLNEDYDVVMWEKHGAFAVDMDILRAFDQIDVMNKSAQIYIAARNMGFEPLGTTYSQMTEMSNAFGLPK